MSKLDEIAKYGGYIMNMVCGNCGWQGAVDIARGNTADSKPCPNCGCNTLHRTATL